MAQLAFEVRAVAMQECHRRPVLSMITLLRTVAASCKNSIGRLRWLAKVCCCFTFPNSRLSLLVVFSAEEKERKEAAMKIFKVIVYGGAVVDLCFDFP